MKRVPPLRCRLDQVVAVLFLVSFSFNFSASHLLYAQQPDAEGLRFFEQKIRPVLIEHCYECHSTDSKTLQGKLQVDFRDALLEGGDSGPAIAPGKPEESLLLTTLRYTGDSYDMPPKGKLPDSVIADFEKWIRMGAPDPRDGEPSKLVRSGIDIEAGKKFWSLQPPKESPEPKVSDTTWPNKKIDHFILAALDHAGLKPSSVADRRTLIRRAYFDLVGLPPTHEEIENFVQDKDPSAYEKLIERLLSSPHYGERWGRHWLDVVRYAEDNVNMGPHNGPYPHAYRYRDWVVQSVNADIPYDQFLRYQLAADLMPGTTLEDLAALGLIGLSPQYHKELLLSQTALESVHADEWEDRVDIIGRGLMGLTVACARCHDHKYDPITTHDYYALAGVFASIRQRPRPILPEEEIAKSQPARDAAKKLQEEIEAINKEIAALKKVKTESAEEKAKQGKQIASLQRQVAEKKTKIEELKASTPNFDLPMVDAVTEEQVRFEKASDKYQKFAYYPNTPRDLPVMIRGNVTSLGEIVPRRFLEVLSDGKPEPFKQGSGRLELAEAIISPQNPLTARVFVNRVWQRYFGEGIVDTPSNFGLTGSAPSHPELLDDLAVRFVKNGWSLKWLHREIILSSTYQQTSNATSQLAEEKDQGNRLLWRFNRRRLDAESLHDALLVAGGNMNRQMGGPSASIDDPKFDRRAVYATISRKDPSEFLQVNDFPDPTIHAEQRSLTTTPLQQLFVLNSPFVKQQAIRLSERVPAGTLEERIENVHRLLFGREPSDLEIKRGLAFLQASTAVEQAPVMDQQLPTFDGHRVKLNIPQLGDTYSIEMWFRNVVPIRERPITGYLFSRGNDGSPNADGDHLGIAGTSKPQTAGRLLFFNGNKKRESLVGKTVLEVNRWYHVTLVREGDQVRVHLNGATVPEISGTVSPGYDSNGTDMFLGGRNDRFANFRGQMGGVALHKRALSSSEIGDHYRQVVQADGTPNLKVVNEASLSSSPYSYWPLFNRPMHDNQVRDLTSHQRHGVYEGVSASAKAMTTPWHMYCHALLCSNELLFVD